MAPRTWEWSDEQVLALIQYLNQSAGSSKNEATQTCGQKPIGIHPDKDKDSENRAIDRQIEGAGQQMECAQRGGQYTRHPEEEKFESNQKMEASRTETEAAEIAKKGLEKKEDGMNFSEFLPMENPRGDNFIEPIDKGWEIVDCPINLVVPPGPSDRSSSWVGIGDPQSKSLLSQIKEDIKEAVRVIAPTRRPDPIAQVHRAQHSSSSKHVAQGKTPKKTDSEASHEIGAYIAHDGPADVEEYQIVQKASKEHLDPGVDHPQHLDIDSPILRRVGTDKIAGRPKSAEELQFPSLQTSLGNIISPPKYLDKPISDSPLARTRLLLPGELSRS